MYLCRRINEGEIKKSVEIIGFGAEEAWHAEFKNEEDKKLEKIGYLMGAR